jgi:iron-sulfur cluster repair protein YtfE (RIC family)
MENTMAQQDDACTLLDEDHNKAMRLFEQHKASHDGSHQKLLARQICHELQVHMQIEDEIFYPAFAQATGDTALVQESKREHQEARELIAKIEDSPVDDAKLMLELEDVILDHVNDEREKMFPEARKAKGLNLMQLARQLEARKSELMAEHPA